MEQHRKSYLRQCLHTWISQVPEIITFHKCLGKRYTNQERRPNQNGVFKEDPNCHGFQQEKLNLWEVNHHRRQDTHQMQMIQKFHITLVKVILFLIRNDFNFLQVLAPIKSRFLINMRQKNMGPNIKSIKLV